MRVCVFGAPSAWLEVYLLLRQFRCFATVANEGSVIRAATTLRLAQPALSRQLQNLERAVGMRLLHRGPRGVRLTPAGTALLASIEPLFDRLAELLRRVQLASEGRLGTLRLGLGRVALDSPRVGRALLALGKEFPDVQIVVSEADSHWHSARLHAGELDLAIGLSGSGDTRLSTLPLYDFQVDSAVLPAAHSLAACPSISMAQLRGERLLVIDPAVAGPIPTLFAQLTRMGIDTWETHESIESVYGMVAAARGWTVGSAALEMRPPAGTAVVPVRGFSVSMTVAARWRCDDDSPLVANIARFLRQAAVADSVAGQSPAPSKGPGAPQERVPPGLESHHFRAVLALAELGSFARAATRLGMSPSGLSRRIRSLERDVGVSLLRRRLNGLALTAAGEVLRDEAPFILALIEDAAAEPRRTEAGVRTGAAERCRIGAVAAEFSGEIVVEAFKYLSRHHPCVRLHLTEMLTMQQVLALREQRIDLGIAGANAGVMDDPLIAGVRLAEDVIECALLAESHPLASRSWLRPSDLADVPFIFLDRSASPKFYDAVMESFAGIGLVPRITGAFNGPRALWRSAADSLGWSLGSRSMRARPLAGLVAVPIEGLHIPSGLQLLWRRDERNPAVLSVLEAFRQLPSSDTQAMGGAAPT